MKVRHLQRKYVKMYYLACPIQTSQIRILPSRAYARHLVIINHFSVDLVLQVIYTIHLNEETKSQKQVKSSFYLNHNKFIPKGVFSLCRSAHYLQCSNTFIIISTTAPHHTISSPEYNFMITILRIFYLGNNLYNTKVSVHDI